MGFGLLISICRRGNGAFETKPTPIKIKPLQAIIVLFFGILGIFRERHELNSIFLTLLSLLLVRLLTILLKNKV
jgi:hypothetical protein